MQTARIGGMERYFFHLHNDIDAPDLEGQEFDNDKLALTAALASVRDLASADVRQGHLNLGHFIICVSGSGREVGIVRFSDAIAISPAAR